MGSERHHIRFVRALAGCCAVLWLAGSLSVTQGNLTPQWTTPHCPQGQAPSAKHSHCVWHCDGIEAHPSSGRSGAWIVVPNGYVRNPGEKGLFLAMVHMEIVPRGPPGFLFERM